MAVTTNMPVRVDGRKYTELPKGMRRWTAAGSATGTVAGTIMSFNADVNPQANPDFQQYVSVSSVGIQTQTAALTILQARVIASVGFWEDYLLATRAVYMIDMVNVSTALIFGGVMIEPSYLGRVIKGTTGRILTDIEEVDGTNYSVTMTGLMSDYPFLAPEFWKV